MLQGRNFKAALVFAALAGSINAYAAWDAAPTLLDSSANVAGPVQVGIEPFGNAVTVWTQGTDVLSRTWNGSAWTAETIVDTLGTVPEDARISINANGDGVAVWRQPVAGTLQVFAARYTGGSGTWSAPAQLSSLASNALEPRIALGNDAAGAMAVWRQNNGSETNLFASRWNGSSWSAAVVVDNLTGNTNAPNVAVDNVGNAVALWEQFDGSADTVFASVWNGTNWSVPQQLDGLTGFIDTPHLAMTGTGQAIAVWQGFGGGEFNIYASRLPSLLGAWSAPVLLDTLVGSAYDPRIAVNSSGNAVVVWEQTNGGVQDLYAARWNGSAWSAPAAVQAAAAGGVGIIKPQVGIDGSGNAIVVYSAGGELMANRGTSGGWGVPVSLEGTPGAVGNPQIAVNSTGQAVAVWQQNQNVYAQHYALDPTFSVTVNSNPVAGGSASCTPTNGIVSGGSTVCTATANAGYVFTQWTTTWGATSGTCNTATCTIPNITGNATITAHFTAAPAPVNGVCGSANGAAVSSAPTANLCTAGTPSAVAGSGPWTWSCAGSNGGSTASCSAPLLPPTTYPITVLINPPAAGTASCTPNPVTSGGTTVCTATANAGYTWSNFVYGPMSSICGSNPCTIPNVPGAFTVTANFAAAPAAAGDAQPVPTLSHWGLMLLSLLCGGGAWIARRRG